MWDTEEESEKSKTDSKSDMPRDGNTEPDYVTESSYTDTATFSEFSLNQQNILDLEAVLKKKDARLVAYKKFFQKKDAEVIKACQPWLYKTVDAMEQNEAGHNLLKTYFPEPIRLRWEGKKNEKKEKKKNEKKKK